MEVSTFKIYSYFKLVCVASYFMSDVLSFGVLTSRVNWDDREKLEDSTVSEKKKKKRNTQKNQSERSNSTRAS